MHVSLGHPSELTGADVGDWRALRAADAAHDNPFLAPEFAQAVGRLRTDARVLIVRDAAGEVRPVLPMQLAASGLARPLGAPMCDVNGPIGAVEDKARLPQALGRAGVAAYTFSGWTGAAVLSVVKMRARGISGGGSARRVLCMARRAARASSQALQEDAPPCKAGRKGFRAGDGDVWSSDARRPREVDRLEARTVRTHAAA